MAPEPSQAMLDLILAAARVGENDDWEFKSAKGGFPASAWETYSAMANSAGGSIVLGATERGTRAVLDGVPREQLEKLKKTFWDQHNNRQNISRALVASGDVQDLEVDGGWLLAIRVPQATRQERPIYKGQNPFEGTYKRRHEGDYRCSPEEVRRMLADADNIPADARILDGFGLEDLDEPSLAAFRNLWLAAKPSHPWLALSGTDQLEKLGCWRYDRDSGDSGLTLAGLLIFGKHHSIISPGAAPDYLVDFRDYRGRKASERWGDRLFPDGTWEANLFQFYQRCWPKVVADLKVPFVLRGVQRVDETPVHEALREAVVNSMIHADYKVGGGIVIKRYDDSYQIENPGTLLVSQEQLRRGGVSECRNKALQRMFMLIGIGEQAGSGFARIQDGWKNQSWRAPRLTEQHGPDRVRLDMPMISLMPKEAFEGLRNRIGIAFDGLAEGERVALATALIEGDVTNTRMQDLVANHPSDITKLLRGLVVKGYLDTDNQRRWTRYSLPSAITPRPDLFSNPSGEPDGAPPSGLPNTPSVNGGTPSVLDATPSVSGDTPSVSPPETEAWKAAAARISGKGRVTAYEMQAVILELCRGRYLTLAELASLLDRKPQNLRNTYLTPMTRSGLLQFRYPDQPGHNWQAYTAADTPPHEPEETP